MKTHSGKKSNKCNQCDFVSFYEGALRTHLKTHSGEKWNKCNQCEYKSSRADHLRTHLKIHSGEKSYKCNQCNYASSQTGELRRHSKRHTGETVWLDRFMTNEIHSKINKGCCILICLINALFTPECDEYIRIFEYSNILVTNIYSDIRSYQFFFYEYIRRGFTL